MTSYTLSATLSGHEDDVRCVISPSDDLIVSSSRDGTVRYWNKQSPIQWEASVINYHAGSFVNSLSWVNLNKSFPYVVSGGNDAIINLTILKPNAEPDFALIGHKSNISSLDTYDDLIISGSWDSTAKVWKDGNVLYDLKGHENSVWGVKIISPNEFITCSADQTIRKWKKDKQIGIYKGHTDVVRDIILLNDGNIASCSNDSSIKIWDTNYKCIKTLKGHESFIYSLTQLPNGDIISASEDRTIRIWSDFKCTQVITFPSQTVWNVNTVHGTSDIITASDDGKIRVFTKEKERIANADDLSIFEEEVAQFSISVDSIPKFNKESLPSIEILTTKVKNYEGELIYVKTNFGNIEAFRWSIYSNRWYKIGNVIEGSSTSKKKEYLGKMYDYVLDVDVKEGSPPLKLAFNANDNPYTVADEFLSLNELPSSYREEVVQFILQVTGSVNITETPTNSAPAEEEELYNSRVYNPYMNTGSTNHPSSAVPSLVILPQKEYLTFKEIDFTKVFAGLEKINKTQDSNVQLTNDEITEFLEAVEKNNTSLFLKYTTQIIKTWSDGGKLVGFDLLRYLITNLKVPTDDLIDILKIGLAAECAPKTVLVVLRCLCNMFINTIWGEMMLNDADVLDILFTESVFKLVKSEKLLSVTAATLLINFSVLMTRSHNLQFSKPLLTIIDKLVQDTESILLNNSESSYRLLIAYGTILYTTKKSIPKPSWIIGIEEKFGGESRFGTVLEEIKSLTT